jgi:hypothetical protein
LRKLLLAQRDSPTRGAARATADFRAGRLTMSLEQTAAAHGGETCYARHPQIRACTDSPPSSRASGPFRDGLSSSYYFGPGGRPIVMQCNTVILASSIADDLYIALLHTKKLCRWPDLHDNDT